MPTTKRNPRTTLITTLLTALTLTLTTQTNAQQTMTNPNQPQGITVTGTGTAQGEPNQALITLGIDAVKETIAEALQEADATMHDIREAALKHGIQERHIRTQNFNVWRQQLSNNQGEPTGERYHVQHTFTLTINDLNKVSDLLHDALEAGANDINGIRFTTNDPATLQDQARQAAMANAKHRAEQLAQLAGVTLGAPTYIQETTAGGPPAPLMAEAQFSRAATTPIQPGELTITLTVNVTYAINQTTP